MIASRWWLLVIAVASAASVVLLVALGTPAPSIWVGFAAVALYAALFLALRRRVIEGGRNALVLAGATIVLTALLTGVQPELATLQFFAYPLIWTVAGSKRSAIALSGVLAAAVGVGFWFAFGQELVSLPTILGMMLLSFGFSCVMGLWISRIAELGEEKARLLDELTSAQEQLAHAHHDAGVLAERARMSREMHDTVAQSLTGLVLLAQRARRGFASGSLDGETLELIETGARDALAETRALVAANAPVELSSGGLAEALVRLGERFERETRIRIAVEATPAPALDRDSEVVLLRCAQEALANIRKHSEAGAARIRLAAEADAVRLLVTDDGRGIAPGAPAGFGLAGLRDRLAVVGGALHIESAPGRTTVTATLPIGDES